MTRIDFSSGLILSTMNAKVDVKVGKTFIIFEELICPPESALLMASFKLCD